MTKDIPSPSWELFDECKICFTAPRKPCYKLTSKSSKLVETSVPHPGRKRLKK